MNVQSLTGYMPLRYSSVSALVFRILFNMILFFLLLVVLFFPIWFNNVNCRFIHRVATANQQLIVWSERWFELTFRRLYLLIIFSFVRLYFNTFLSFILFLSHSMSLTVSIKMNVLWVGFSADILLVLLID